MLLCIFFYKFKQYNCAACVNLCYNKTVQYTHITVKYLQEEKMFRKIDDIANTINKMTEGFIPQTAVILGSGLSDFCGSIEEKFSLSFSQIESFPRTSVSGHSGRLIFGEKYGKNIVIMSGRIHYYEGFSMQEVVLPVRVLKRLGVSSLIVTNAAGSINNDYDKGDIMLIKNHISLFCPNPLIGRNMEEFGERFPDMTFPYDKEYIAEVKKLAQRENISIKEGVYCYLTGPSYETAADISALRVLGADCVGMSTVPEVTAAAHAGIRVCGFSCISNKGAGLTDEKLSHQDVVNSCEDSKNDLYKLIDGMLKIM